MRKIKIDPKIVDPADTEMLEDLILAATRDARTKVEAAMAEEMQKVTGGIAASAGNEAAFLVARGQWVLLDASLLLKPTTGQALLTTDD